MVLNGEYASHVDQMAELPLDVLPLVAEHLPCTDLRALSLTSKAWCVPARRALFRSVIITADTRETWILRFLVFLDHNPYLQWNVHHLSIQSTTSDYMNGVQPTLCLLHLLSFTGRLFNLKTLSMKYCKWHTTEDFHFDKHHTLQHLSMYNVHVNDPSSDISDILRLAQCWVHVHLISMPMFKPPITARYQCLRLKHLTIEINLGRLDVSTVLSALRYFQDLTVLEIRHLQFRDLVSLANQLRGASRTLEEIVVHVVLHDRSKHPFLQD